MSHRHRNGNGNRLEKVRTDTVEIHPLYSNESIELLEGALKTAVEAEQETTIIKATTRSRYDSSSDEESNNEDDDSDESSISSTKEKEKNPELPTKLSVVAVSKNKSKTNQPSKNALVKQFGQPPVVKFPTRSNNEKTESPFHMFVQVPSALLSKHDRFDDLITRCRSSLNLARSLRSKNSNVIILLLRSGRFAGGIFSGPTCITHRTYQRYTQRRGQGKAQSSMDSSKGKANSMGAQLRRAGEINLRQDVATTLHEWHDSIKDAAIIFLGCPPTMKKGLFDDTPILSKLENRTRKIPLDFGRPTHESVCAVHEVMMQVRLVVEDQTIETNAQDDHLETKAADENIYNGQTKEESKIEKEVEVITPLTPLHTAAAQGNLMMLTDLLESNSNDYMDDNIDLRAGQDFMTPLHYAAAATAADPPSSSLSSSLSATATMPSQQADAVPAQAAAACVSFLLLQGHANPCVLDSRNRPPYFCASHDKVRDVFRIARSKLGEEYCLWDEKAKVGPPLTLDDVHLRKEKLAEKKRRQRARQKEKKTKEKAHAQQVEQLQKEQNEQRKQEQDAKRIRDGLQPKATCSASGNLCDFCQKVCKGKRRAQMLKRLEYAYCSSDCVQKHKRELITSAALARFES